MAKAADTLVVGTVAMAAEAGVARSTITRWIATGRLRTKRGQANRRGGPRPHTVSRAALLRVATRP